MILHLSKDRFTFYWVSVRLINVIDMIIFHAARRCVFPIYIYMKKCCKNLYLHPTLMWTMKYRTVISLNIPRFCRHCHIWSCSLCAKPSQINLSLYIYRAWGQENHFSATSHSIKARDLHNRYVKLHAPGMQEVFPPPPTSQETAS